MSSILQTPIQMCSAVLMLAACAASGSSPSSQSASVAQSQGASPALVQANFEDGVVEVCGNYFLSDLDIQKTSKTTNLKLSKLRTGSRYPGGIVTGMPVHAASDGVVHIKENLIGRSCEVFAYGIPVDATFDNIATRLTANGYTEEEQSDVPEKHDLRTFQRVSNDIVIIITLKGNKAGAEGTISRFSTLTGYVSFKGIE